MALFLFKLPTQKMTFYFLNLSTLVAVVLYMIFPKNEGVIAFLCTSGILIDIVGVNIYPNFIHENYPSGTFSSLLNRHYKYDIGAKLVAGGCLWLSSFSHFSNAPQIILLCALLVHLIVFQKAFPKAPAAQQGVAWTRIREASQFLSMNPLVRYVLLLTVTASAMKFFNDYIYWKTVNDSFSTAPQVAGFMSRVDLALNLICLPLVPILTMWAMNKLELSFSLAVLPAMMLVLSTVGLFHSSLPFSLIIYFGYYLSFRSFQRPLSRQSMVTAPDRIRGEVFMLIGIAIAVISSALGMAFTVLKSYFDIELAHACLLFISIPALLYTRRLDAYYLRNMWSLAKEKAVVLSSNNITDNFMGPMEGESGEESTGPNQKIENNSIEAVFALSLKENAITRACKRLALGLLRSQKPEAYYWTLRHFSPQFRELVIAITKKLRPEIDPPPSFQVLNHIESDWPLKRLNKVSEYQLIDYLMRRLSVSHFSNLPKLRMILNLSPELRQDLITILFHDKSREIENYVYECIDDSTGSFSLEPALDNLKYFSFESSYEYLSFLGSLAKYDEDEVDNFIKKELDHVKKVSLRKLPDAESDHDYDKFIKCLYLSEVLIKPRTASREVRATLWKLFDKDEPSRDLLVDIHQRMVVQSPHRKQLLNHFL